MLTRVFTVAVVLFWITMNGLLLRHELQPAGSAFREVPPAHIVKLLLHHEQASDLNIYSEKLRLGHLRILPKLRAEDGRRTIAFAGGLQLRLPGVKPQRIAWDGSLTLEKTLAMREFRLGFTSHEPQEARIEITAFPAANRGHYALTSAGKTVLEREFALDETSVRGLLAEFGLDPALWRSLGGSADGMPVIAARQSTMEIRGEKIDTYLVTIVHHGQTLLEFHVSQLGQILGAKTLIGYTLAPEDL